MIQSWHERGDFFRSVVNSVADGCQGSMVYKGKSYDIAIGSNSPPLLCALSLKFCMGVRIAGPVVARKDHC